MEKTTNTFKPIRQKSEFGRTSIALATGNHRLKSGISYRLSIDARFKFHHKNINALTAAASVFHNFGHRAFTDFWHDLRCKTGSSCSIKSVLVSTTFGTEHSGCPHRPSLVVLWN